MNGSYKIALGSTALLAAAVLAYFIFFAHPTDNAPAGPAGQTAAANAGEATAPNLPPPPAVAPGAPAAGAAASATGGDPTSINDILARMRDHAGTPVPDAAKAPEATTGTGAPGAPGAPVAPALPVAEVAKADPLTPLLTLGAPTTAPATMPASASAPPGSAGGASETTGGAPAFVTPPTLGAFDSSKSLGLDNAAPGGGAAPSAPGTAPATGAAAGPGPINPLADPAKAAGTPRTPDPAPTVTTGGTTGPAGAGPKTYTVKAGDSLSSIARSLYGSEKHWNEIAQANPTVDPSRLRIGQVLKLPEPVKTAPTPRPDAPATQPARLADGSTTYIVKPSETLYAIAKQHYGSGELWQVIYKANQQTIGADPGKLKAGLKLLIPPAPAPTTRQSRAPAVTHPAPDLHETMIPSAEPQK